MTVTVPMATTMPMTAAPMNLLGREMRDFVLINHSRLRRQFGFGTSHLRLGSEHWCCVGTCRGDNTSTGGKAEGELQKVTTFHIPISSS
ncbi:hypothetical protein V1291_005497 [Nitrobacteraceae bacterium AZCC 1564]